MGVFFLIVRKLLFFSHEFMALLLCDAIFEWVLWCFWSDRRLWCWFGAIPGYFVTPFGSEKTPKNDDTTRSDGIRGDWFEFALVSIRVREKTNSRWNPAHRGLPRQDPRSSEKLSRCSLCSSVFHRPLRKPPARLYKLVLSKSFQWNIHSICFSHRNSWFIICELKVHCTIEMQSILIKMNEMKQRWWLCVSWAVSWLIRLNELWNCRAAQDTRRQERHGVI